MNPAPHLVHRLTSTARWLLLTIGALVLIVTFTPVTAWAGYLLGGPWTHPQRGVLLVLSGSELAEGFIGPDTYWRCVYAARTWRAGHFDRVYVIGGTAYSTSEASSMKLLLISYGIPAERIVEEGRSMSTRENAEFVKPLLTGVAGPRILLTSDMHCLRARRVFARAGIPVETQPVPDLIKRGGQFSQRWGAFVDLIRELAALGYYAVHGWL